MFIRDKYSNGCFSIVILVFGVVISGETWNPENLPRKSRNMYFVIGKSQCIAPNHATCEQNQSNKNGFQQNCWCHTTCVFQKIFTWKHGVKRKWFPTSLKEKKTHPTYKKKNTNFNGIVGLKTLTFSNLQSRSVCSCVLWFLVAYRWPWTARRCVTEKIVTKRTHMNRC